MEHAHNYEALAGQVVSYYRYLQKEIRKKSKEPRDEKKELIMTGKEEIKKERIRKYEERREVS